MRKVRLFLFVAIVSVFFSTSIFAYQVMHSDVSKEQVVKGVQLVQGKLLTDAGFLRYNAYIVDGNDNTISVETARNLDDFRRLQKISDMTNSRIKKGENVIGSVNGSFYSASRGKGEVIGVEIKDGDISYGIDDYNIYKKAACNFINENDEYFLDYIDINLKFRNGNDAEVRAGGVNTAAIGDWPIIFNNKAYKNSDDIAKLGNMTMYLVENDIVKSVVTRNVALNDNNYIIGIKNSRLVAFEDFFIIGDKIKFIINSGFDTEKIKTAISGGGRLLSNGNYVLEGLYVSPNNRHPRTSIGINKKDGKLFLLTVDGRGSSMGATASEVARIMKELGATDAIHLDGGGSTTFVKRNVFNKEAEVVNRVSDGVERKVVNGVIIKVEREKSDKYNLVLKPSSKHTFVKNAVKLQVAMTDSNGNIVDVDEKAIAFSTSGNAVVQNMNFIPNEKGDFKITANYKGVSASATVTVDDKLTDIIVSPKVIKGDGKITLQGIDSNGYKVTLSPDQVTFKMQDGLGTIKGGVFKSNGKTGQVEVQYKNMKEYFYVVPESQQNDIIDMTSLNVTRLTYPEFVLGNAYADEAGITISYDFRPSEQTQAVYAQFENFVLKDKQRKLVLKTSQVNENVTLKGTFIDSKGKSYSREFVYDDGVATCNVENMNYPVRVDRIYVVTLKTETQKEGVVVISDMVLFKDVEYKGDIANVKPYDDMYAYNVDENAKKLGIFGSTSYRRNLLTEIVLSQVYKTFKTFEYGVFAGNCDVDLKKGAKKGFMMANNYTVNENEFGTFISLKARSRSFVKADSSQYNNLVKVIKNTKNDIIVITANFSLLPRINKRYGNEATVFHNKLSEFAKVSGKKIFYINTGTSKSNINFYEGVRYIDLPTINSPNKDPRLHDDYKMFILYKNGENITYKLEEVYPLAVVTK